ncbi:hypothetical protein FXO38_29511 [Capsicum annuum]|nr:hypothetical protein FXO38_29511 [Capsicum annuum]KAF3629814.1 hypothetical protein FXO37_28752 [Capsicum annuum]
MEDYNAITSGPKDLMDHWVRDPISVGEGHRSMCDLDRSQREHMGCSVTAGGFLNLRTQARDKELGFFKSYTQQVDRCKSNKLIGPDAAQVIFNDLASPKSDYYFDPLSKEAIRNNSNNTVVVMESSMHGEDENQRKSDSNTGIKDMQSKIAWENMAIEVSNEKT